MGREWTNWVAGGPRLKPWSKTPRCQHACGKWTGLFGTARWQHLTVLHDRAPVLIADAKYKLRAPDDPIHADLYQMLAYCTAGEIDRGMLIYPKWEHAGFGTIAIRNSPIQIVRETIDLSGTVDDLKREIERLANRLVEIAVRYPPRRSELVEEPIVV